MATINYGTRLQNVRNRKFDGSLNESLISKSFSRTDIPENIKYLLEITKPLGDDYNARTKLAAERVQNHLEKGFNLHFDRAYRNQGSVMTNTNIKVFSDFDLLTIIDRYHFTGPNVPNNNPYTESNPNSDIEDLRSQATKILKAQYDEVDDSGTKSISIFNKALYRKVDVVFCFWYNIEEYERTKDEYYRGIYLYDFDAKRKILDYPFAHIQSVNSKGANTYDGSRKGIRMLKNIRSDSDNKLNSFQLTTIIHSMDNGNLPYQTGTEGNLAYNISQKLQSILDDSNYRKSINSPNGTECPLKDDDCVKEIEKIKDELDTLVRDSYSELKNSTLQKSITGY